MQFLIAKGWTIVDRNWRCREGELDIVARERDALVFVEVKTRTSLRFGHPFDAVTPKKLMRLRLLSIRWRQEHPTTPGESRIDIVAVVVDPDDSVVIEHLCGVHA